MKPIIKFTSLKEIVNKKGLRISRDCHSKLDSLTNKLIDKAVEKAKEENARQLSPKHFEEEK